MSKGLEKLQHIVVLMMENCSFDHMVGFLQSDDYKIDGLSGDESNPPASGSTPVKVSSDAQDSGDLNPDPNHNLVSVNVQIFGDPQGVPGTDPPMSGFVRDYAAKSGSASWGANIMKCFNEYNLPVLSTLAKNYAVCDRWFSSLPSKTDPNRMFVHAATSLGCVVNDPNWTALKTIFEVLDSDPENPNDYRIYHHGFQTSLLIVQHLLARQDNFREFNHFKGDCADGDLPAYTFIEPRYTDEKANGSIFPANDQHPNNDVFHGEQLIRTVYEGIGNRADLWESTLLLIVYDEHGGIYDHVQPPKLDPPYLPPSVAPRFLFDRLGVRVPAVLVSPYIPAMTIYPAPPERSKFFEHSSIVATVRKLFAPKAGPLTIRDARANTFEGVLGDEFRGEPVAIPSHRSLFATPALSVPRLPSELAFSMARGMEDALHARRLFLETSVDSIYSATDAAAYMRKAGEKLLGVKSHGR